MVVWLQETNGNQTSESNGTFTAAFNASSGGDTSGVTGVITAAQ